MTAPLTDEHIAAMLASAAEVQRLRAERPWINQGDEQRLMLFIQATQDRDEARAALAEAVEILRCTDCVCTDEARSMTKAFLAKHGGAKP